MSNLHLQQTNHRVLSGGCNEPMNGTRDAAAAWGTRMDKNVELSWGSSLV